jgi:hypothetical protein
MSLATGQDGEWDELAGGRSLDGSESLQNFDQVRHSQPVLLIFRHLIYGGDYKLWRKMAVDVFSATASTCRVWRASNSFDCSNSTMLRFGAGRKFKGGRSSLGGQRIWPKRVSDE